MSNPSKEKLESKTEAGAPPAWQKPVLLCFWLVVLGLFYAEVEIQVEGGAGWAGNLPTWRVENHPLLKVFWGGKTLTGYHLWLFTFMALAFHLPLVLCGTWSVRLESRVLGSIMVFWIIEDFIWFALNPAFGLSRFQPESVPWHKHWMLGVPVDYVISVAIGIVLIWFSYRGKRHVPAASGNSEAKEEQR